MRCDHCLLEFPERDAVRDEGSVFCCTGCAGIHRLIRGEGLETFYARREWHEAGVAVSPERASLDVGAFAPLVRDDGELRELDVAIEGIRCASCVWLNERVLASTPGVTSARVSYATHRARVRWDPRALSLDALLGRVTAIGYMPRPFTESAQARAQAAEVRDLLVRLGTAGFLSSQLMIYTAALYAGYFQGMEPGVRRLMEWVALGLTLPVFFYAGAPFLRGAWAALRHGRFNMDSLVALGSGAALVYSIVAMAGGREVYFDTAAMIPTLVLVGRFIEAAARRRVTDTVGRLAQLLPRQARRLEAAGGDATLVPLSQVMVGDRVLVLPGERVPVDGAVLEGCSQVDESLVTGESRPVDKAPGADVIGGTMNQAGTFTVQVSRVGGDTVLAGIDRAVAEAREHKPRLQALADRLTGVFVPVVLLLAAAAAAGHLLLGYAADRALLVGVAVVVIACPCALGLATPLAVLVATTAATARGILIKRGHALERAARLDRVVLDKTGTLTRGEPSLSALVPLDPATTRDEALAVAAAVERRSEHGIARAVAEAARHLPGELPAVSDFEVVPGRGVRARVGDRAVTLGSRAHLDEAGVARPAAADIEAERHERAGETVVWLAWGGAARALLCVTDPVRDESPAAVVELQRLDLRSALVSGDDRTTCETVASRVGIAEVHAGASPQGKRELVLDLQRRGARVLAVGDGLNDAPVLEQADVGLAMGRGVDVTLESADAVLVRDDLRLVGAFVRLGRRTTRIIRQNLFWALFYNVVAIPLSVAGLLHPIVAAAAMAASSSFVVVNSLRVRAGEV